MDQIHFSEINFSAYPPAFKFITPEPFLMFLAIILIVAMAALLIYLWHKNASSGRRPLAYDFYRNL